MCEGHPPSQDDVARDTVAAGAWESRRHLLSDHGGRTVPGPVNDLTPIKIIVVAKNRTWLHAYLTAKQLKDDASGPPLGDAEFYTVDGRQLTAQLDGKKLKGLDDDGAPPDEAAVQQAVDAAIAGVRAKVERSSHPASTKQDALTELARLDGKSLSERFDLMFALPLGHPTVAGANHVLGFHTTPKMRDPGSFIHMILFH
jgi:hypothetical protein